MNESYNYENETLKHKIRVFQLMQLAVKELLQRAAYHDDSKLHEPEKVWFEEWTPKLAATTYGSKEYEDMLKELKPALEHHYTNNAHHPEHFDNGIQGMDLFDIIEMTFDWLAAVERHNDGDIYKSLKINKERFSMSEELYIILYNTYKKIEKNGEYKKP